MCDEHTPVCQVGASAAAVRAWWWWCFEKSSFRLDCWLRLLWNPTPSSLSSPLDLLVWLLFGCNEPRPRPAYRLIQETRSDVPPRCLFSFYHRRLESSIWYLTTHPALSSLLLFVYFCIILFVSFCLLLLILLAYGCFTMLLFFAVQQSESAIFIHISLLFWSFVPFRSGFPGSDGKESACNEGAPGDLVQSLGWEDPLEKELATHSSILAWRTPWSLAGYSPWSRKELDTTEQITLSPFRSPQSTE